MQDPLQEELIVVTTGWKLNIHRSLHMEIKSSERYLERDSPDFLSVYFDQSALLLAHGRQITS